MKQLISILLLLFVSFSFAQTPLNVNDPLPEDPAVSKGVLENGMTYYVRANSTPKNRADLFLIVRAGSIDEDDDQQGLAHFAEHMAFNGTKNFPKNDLIKYLESIGMEFGPEINAYTSFDETVYMIKVPLDDDEFVEKGLQVMYDWASQVTDSDEEIDKERGVIHEEWRGGRGANERMMQKWLPVFLHNSRYAERLPIGKIEIVDNCPPEVLRRYRKDWYRPDLQAIIVVGDFDQQEMVERVKAKFSQIPAVENPREKKYYDIPGHDETLVSVVTDKEAQYPVAQIFYKHPLKINEKIGDYRESITHGLFNGMINKRLQELTQSANPPFIYAATSYDELFGPASVYSSVAVCQNGKIEDGVKAVLLENERVKRFGFTQTELERQKKAVLSHMEKLYNDRDKHKSIGYANEYKRNFLMTKEPFPGIENEYNYYKTFLPGISLEEVNALAAEWIIDKNQVVVVTAPEIEGVKVPTEEEVLALLKEVEETEVEAYKDEVIDKPLIAEKLTPGKVVNEKQLEKVDAVEWTLSNGAVVVAKKTDFKDDEILFTAYSFGGNSQYGQEDDISADIASTIIDMSGISEFDNVTLQKMLAGKVFSISPYLSELTEGFKGSSSVKDLQSLMEILYLYFTDIRVDEKSFSSYMTRIAGVLENKKASPEAAFKDTFQVVSVNYHPRKRPMELETIKEANLEAIKKIAHDRFTDASDFKFFFVGNIDFETLKPMVEKYIGAIPSSYRKENWKDLNIQSPEGVVEKTVYRGQEEKSIHYLAFHGDYDYNKSNVLKVDAAGKILTTRLLEVVREDKSSVYYIGASPSIDKLPKEEYSVVIYYGTAPEKVKELQDIVFDEIEDFQTNGPSEEEVNKAKEKLLREREVNLRENGFWLGALKSGYLYNGGDFSEFDEFNDLVEGLTPQVMQSVMKDLFNKESYYSVILKPEKAE